MIQPNQWRALTLGTFLCALASCGASDASPTEDAQRPPNIVFFMADDLGYGEVGAYGQELIPTPNIDSLARDGMLFTNHYSGSPVCAPSRCVLLTGLHTGHSEVRNNWENGGWGQDQSEGQWPLAPNTQTLARVLQAKGYATGGVGKWGLGGPGTTGAPENQGFDHFSGYLCQRIAHNHYPTHLWRDGERVELEGNEWVNSHQKLKEPLDTEDEYWERYNGATYAHDVMLADAVSFVREHKDEPFFLYYASPIPHASLQAPPEDLDAFPREWDQEHYLGNKGYLPHPRPRAAYAAMVAHLDREVGSVLATLDELGLRDNTIVVFTSDNGPTFNGGTDSTFFNSAAGMRGLKCSVYEGGLKVPTLVRWPKHVTAGSSSDLPSAFQDWMPTLLEIAQVQSPTGLDGISLLPTLEGAGEQAKHEALYFEYAGQQALRAGRWKAVRRKLRQGNLVTELYDLEADPKESQDLADQEPEVLARMVGLLNSSRSPSTIFPLPGIDPQAKKK